MTSLILSLLLSTVAAPNVVFISVDTLRADHLGVYGADYNATPNLDRLAENSLLFEDAICELHLTGPSLSAMFSSRLPRVTGVLDHSIPLPPDTPTAAMLFEAAGYETAAIVSNQLLATNHTNLNRGFAHYDTEFKPGKEVILSERAANIVTDRALAWLKQRDNEKPLFFWVHYMDPHTPYGNNPGFDEQLGQKALLVTNKDDAQRHRYKTEVAFVDQQIQRLLDALPKEDTYILFVSDHGESLGEHNNWGHTMNIYQTTMHIPLFIHGPGIEPSRVDRPVRGIDIGPTLLGLADITPSGSMNGMDITKALPAANTSRVFEFYKKIPVPGSSKPRFSAKIQHRTILQDKWKLIRNLDDNSLELYNLAEDPYEKNNIVSEFPEKVSDLITQLDAWDQSNPPGQSVENELTQEDLETLKALGYLDSE